MALRFEYGSAVPWVEALDDGTIRAICGPEMVLLRSPVPHHGEDHTTVAEFTVSAGDCIPLCLATARRTRRLVHVWTPKRRYRIPRPPGVPGRIDVHPPAG